MLYPRVPRRPEPPAVTEAGVYASLDDLVRLQFQASGYSFLPRQPVHSVLAGRHASRVRGRGLDFEELRGYLPGDDVRSIDWKVMARTGKPHVRVFSEERDRPVWLLVDQRQSMFFGSRERMKSVAAAEATALAAWRALKQGDRVGALLFSDTEVVEIAPQRSRRQVHHILAELTRLNRALQAAVAPAASASQFNAVFERIARLAVHDALVVSIGDGSGADEDTRRLATRVCAHNDMLAVFVYDPMERELATGPRQVFSDGHGQLEVDGGDGRLAQRYRDAFATRLAWIEQLARQHTVPLLPVHTAAPVVEQVRALLGQHVAARRV